MTLRLKDKGIEKSELVAKTQCLYFMLTLSNQEKLCPPPTRNETPVLFLNPDDVNRNSLNPSFPVTEIKIYSPPPLPR